MSSKITLIIQHLTHVATLHGVAEKNGILGKIRELQEWQCKRLLASHEPLWTQKRFNPAMQFFIDELYGPKDFTQRDQDIARVVPKMAKILPEKALVSLESAMHLNRLSFELDMDMAKALGDEAINRDSYAKAYRNCKNQTDRALQINYIEVLGQDLSEVVNITGISTLLKLARKPAQIAGVLALHEFLESGFHAFKKLGDVQDFIRPIVTLEREIMLALFDENAPNPLPKGL